MAPNRLGTLPQRRMRANEKIKPTKRKGMGQILNLGGQTNRNERGWHKRNETIQKETKRDGKSRPAPSRPFSKPRETADQVTGLLKMFGCQTRSNFVGSCSHPLRIFDTELPPHSSAMTPEGSPSPSSAGLPSPLPETFRRLARSLSVSQLRKPSTYGRRLSTMIALTAVVQNAAQDLSEGSSSPLYVHIRTPQRATSMPQLLGAVQTHRPAAVFMKQLSEPNVMLASGTKTFLRSDGTVAYSTRQRHGGFRAISLNPILASRHRWRTRAAACLGTHDETSLCSLAARSCADASSMDVSPFGRAVMARPQSSAACQQASTEKIQHFRKAAPRRPLSPVLALPSLPARRGDTSHLRPVMSAHPPRREVLRPKRRLAPVDAGCFSSSPSSTVLSSPPRRTLFAPSFH